MLTTRYAAAGIFLLLFFVLQGCGRKGPLFIQQEPAKPVPIATPQPESAPSVKIQPEVSK